MQSNQRFNLTERQRSIMDYIVQINQETGTTPTQRQISQEFKISQATVAKHLASTLLSNQHAAEQREQRGFTAST